MKLKITLLSILLAATGFSQAGQGRVTYSFTRQMTQKLTRNASLEEMKVHMATHIGQVYNVNWSYVSKVAGGTITVAEKSFVTFGTNRYWIKVTGKVPVTRQGNWLNLKKPLGFKHTKSGCKPTGGQKLRLRGIVKSVKITPRVHHHSTWGRNRRGRGKWGHYYTITVNLGNAVSPDL